MKTLFEHIDLLSGHYEAFVQSMKTDFLGIRNHWHYFVELIFVTKGTVIVEYDEVIYHVSEGEFILFYPKSMHCIYKQDNQDAEYMVIKFNDVILNAKNTYTPKLKYVLTHAKSEQYPHVHFKKDAFNTHVIASLFSEIVEEYTHKKEGYDLIIQSNLHKLFILILRYWKTQGLDISSTLQINQNELIFDQVLEYVDQHYNEALEVNTLALMCNLSYSQFSRQFKHLYGLSCKEYINYIRVNKAQDLLLFTNYDLTFISAEVGYSDSSHFIKQFKKIKQITPHQYRKLHHQSS